MQCVISISKWENMSDSLHHSSNAYKKEKNKLRKAVWNLLCDPLSIKSKRATLPEFHWGVQLQQDCFESPRWTLKSTLVPRTGWRCFTQQMRDTLGVLNWVLGFFPSPICHNKMTVKTYFSTPHEVWNPKSSSCSTELLWQLPHYLWEPVLHLSKPCWSQVLPQLEHDFLSVCQILLRISPFEQL